VLAYRLSLTGSLTGSAYRLTTWVEAACATVEIAVTETMAANATNAAKIASLMRVFRWRFSIFVR